MGLEFISIKVPSLKRPALYAEQGQFRRMAPGEERAGDVEGLSWSISSL